MTFRVPFLKGGPKRNKFGARKTFVDGKHFPSALEAALYVILKQMEKNGEIHGLRCQHAVSLTTAKVRYKIDFSATDTKTGILCFWEAKGKEGDRWKILRRLWPDYGPSILYVFKGSYTRPALAYTLVPKSMIQAK